MARHPRNRKPAARPAADARATGDGFQNLVNRVGLGANNAISEGRYRSFRPITRDELEIMYRQSWVIGRVIDIWAKDMVRAGVELTGVDDPKDEDRLQAALTKLGVWRGILNGNRWGRLYGGALAFLNIEGQDPMTPLVLDTIRPKQFRGLRVYDRHQIQPDPSRFVQDGLHQGTPMFYRLLPGVGPSSGLAGVTAHHSRVVRFIGSELPPWAAQSEEFWGDSVVIRMFDRLVAFDGGTMGAANLLSKAYLRTVGIEKLRDILAAEGQPEQNLIKMFALMAVLQHSEGVTLLDKEDTFQTHAYTFSGLDEILLSFGQQLSGATGIPLVKLFGQAPKGLNATGESDLRLYYDDIQTSQEADLRDGIDTILAVLHRSELGRPAPEGFNFTFAPLWQTSPTEKATNATAIGTNVGARFTEGLIDRATALRELRASADDTGIFGSITDEMIAAAEAEAAPAPPDDPLAQIEAFVAGTTPGAAPSDPLAAIRAFATGEQAEPEPSPGDDEPPAEGAAPAGDDPLEVIKALAAGGQPPQKDGLLARIRAFIGG